MILVFRHLHYLSSFHLWILQSSMVSGFTTRMKGSYENLLPCPFYERMRIVDFLFVKHVD